MLQWAFRRRTPNVSGTQTLPGGAGSRWNPAWEAGIPPHPTSLRPSGHDDPFQKNLPLRGGVGTQHIWGSPAPGRESGGTLSQASRRTLDAGLPQMCQGQRQKSPPLRDNSFLEASITSRPHNNKRNNHMPGGSRPKRLPPGQTTSRTEATVWSHPVV